MRLRLRVVPTGQRLIRSASRWWRENRSAAPDLLAEELEAAFTLITSQPKIGMAAPESDDENVRRLHGRPEAAINRPVALLLSILSLLPASTSLAGTFIVPPDDLLIDRADERG